jgi:TolB-like protein
MLTKTEFFRLELLGPLRLFSPDGRRIEVSSRKGMALLALLAMAPSGERTRSWLQGRLWGGRGAEQAQGSLRRELANLRRLLSTTGEPLLAAGRDRIALATDRFSIDIRDDDEGKLAAGEFLEGIDLVEEDAFEDWLREQRSAIEQRRTTANGSAYRSSALSVVGYPLPSPVELVTSTAYSLPLKPSIAVLPFTDLDPTEGADYFADGVADEISVALSRYSTLFVIASSSSLTYRDDSLSGAEICRQLGVRYLLNGTVRRAAGQVRVVVRLTDGIAGHQVWTETFDGSLADVFALQDTIAASIGPHIDSSIDISERQRALARPVQSTDAYDLFWRANAMFRQWDRESMLEAIDLAEQVLALEPNNAWAACLAALCHGSAYASRWTDDPDYNLAMATTHYDVAMRFGGGDPFVLGYAAGTLAVIGGDMVIADRLVTRALALHPVSPSTLFWGGWVDIAMGKMDRAIDRFETALRLNPRSAGRPYSICGIGVCLLATGRLQEAVIVLEESSQYIPGYPITLAALCIANALSGKTDQARRYAQKLEEAGGVDRVLAILQDPAHRDLLRAGMAMATSATTSAALPSLA